MSQAAVAAVEPQSVDTGSAVALWRRRLGSIYKSTPSAPVTGRGWLLAIGAVVVGTLISVLRQPASGGFETVWAEDGKIFLADAVNKSFLGALATPYNGYYQAVPRLLAEPVLLVPPTWAAPFFTIEASIVTALFGLVVYVASKPHLSSPLSRLLAASIAVASPLAITGIPISLANVHWPGLYALFWVLLWVPQSRTGRIVSVIMCALLPATNILAVIFVPLALLRAAVVRGWLSKVMGALVTLGVLLHLFGLAAGTTTRPIHPTIWGAVTTFVTRTVPSTMTGKSGLYDHSFHRNLAFTLLGWLVVAVVLLLAWRGPTRPNWTVAALAALFSALMWGAAVSTTGLLATRYAAAAGMLLVGGVAALLIPAPGNRGAAVTGAAIAMVGVLYGLNLHSDYQGAQGPRWSTSIQQARAQCAQPGTRTVDVPIAPPSPAWFSHLPCNYLQR